MYSPSLAPQRTRRSPATHGSKRQSQKERRAEQRKKFTFKQRLSKKQIDEIVAAVNRGDIKLPDVSAGDYDLIVIRRHYVVDIISSLLSSLSRRHEDESE